MAKHAVLKISDFPAELQKSLGEFDDEGNGILEMDEIGEVFSSYKSLKEDRARGVLHISNLPTPKFQQLAAAFDANNDGTIEPFEFQRAVEMYQSSQQKAKKLMRLVGLLVVVIAVILSCIAGLVFVVVEASKETKVEDGAFKVKGSTEIVKVSSADSYVDEGSTASTGSLKTASGKDMTMPTAVTDITLKYNVPIDLYGRLQKISVSEPTFRAIGVVSGVFKTSSKLVLSTDLFKLHVMKGSDALAIIEPLDADMLEANEPLPLQSDENQQRRLLGMVGGPSRTLLQASNGVKVNVADEVTPEDEDAAPTKVLVRRQGQCHKAHSLGNAIQTVDECVEAAIQAAADGDCNADSIVINWRDPFENELPGQSDGPDKRDYSLCYCLPKDEDECTYTRVNSIYSRANWRWKTYLIDATPRVATEQWEADKNATEWTPIPEDPRIQLVSTGEVCTNLKQLVTDEELKANVFISVDQCMKRALADPYCLPHGPTIQFHDYSQIMLKPGFASLGYPNHVLDDRGHPSFRQYDCSCSYSCTLDELTHHRRQIFWPGGYNGGELSNTLRWWDVKKGDCRGNILGIPTEEFLNDTRVAKALANSEMNSWGLKEHEQDKLHLPIGQPHNIVAKPVGHGEAPENGDAQGLQSWQRYSSIRIEDILNEGREETRVQVPAVRSGEPSGGSGYKYGDPINQIWNLHKKAWTGQGEEYSALYVYPDPHSFKSDYYQSLSHLVDFGHCLDPRYRVPLTKEDRYWGNSRFGVYPPDHRAAQEGKTSDLIGNTNIYTWNDGGEPCQPVILRDSGNAGGTTWSVPSGTVCADSAQDMDGNVYAIEPDADDPSQIYIMKRGAGNWHTEEIAFTCCKPKAEDFARGTSKNSYRVNVGISNGEEWQTFDVPLGYRCPARVTKDNWLGDYTHDYDFIVEQTMSGAATQVRVKLSAWQCGADDRPYYWDDMYLRFDCAADPDYTAPYAFVGTTSGGSEESKTCTTISIPPMDGGSHTGETFPLPDARYFCTKTLKRDGYMYDTRKPEGQLFGGKTAKMWEHTFEWSITKVGEGDRIDVRRSDAGPVDPNTDMLGDGWTAAVWGDNEVVCCIEPHQVYIGTTAEQLVPEGQWSPYDADPAQEGEWCGEEWGDWDCDQDAMDTSPARVGWADEARCLKFCAGFNFCSFDYGYTGNKRCCRRTMACDQSKAEVSGVNSTREYRIYKAAVQGEVEGQHVTPSPDGWCSHYGGVHQDVPGCGRVCHDAKNRGVLSAGTWGEDVLCSACPEANWPGCGGFNSGACTATMTASVETDVSALCARPGMGTTITYTGTACGNGKILYTSMASFPIPAGLTEADCSWSATGKDANWVATYTGGCGVAPTAVPHLPTTCQDVEISAGKPTAQSSDNIREAPPRPIPASYYDDPVSFFASSRAVDGNWNEHSCSQTAAQDDPWWRVDLTEVMAVEKVKIWNQMAKSPERIDGAKIKLSTVDDILLATDCADIPNITDSEMFTCVGAARFVWVQVHGSGKVVQMCEVKVYGGPWSAGAAAAQHPISSNGYPIKIPEGYTCPATVSMANWLNRDGNQNVLSHSDTFHVKTLPGNDIIVQRSDIFKATSNVPLAIECPLSDECTRVNVGPNPSGTKRVLTVPDGFKCPSKVNQCNAHGGYTFSEIFTVVQIGNEIEVMRDLPICGLAAVDYGSVPFSTRDGWKVDLGFDCCKSHNNEDPNCEPPASDAKLTDWNTVLCSCNSPSGGTVGFNGYTCEDGTTGYCGARDACIAPSFVKFDWAGACKPEVGCTCDYPAVGTAGYNGYTCDDGTTGFCGADQECYAPGFLYGRFDKACRRP